MSGGLARPLKRLVGRLREAEGNPRLDKDTAFMLIGEAADEIERLKKDLAAEVNDCVDAVAEQGRLERLLAEAERLCMEHCPDEMSDELRADWELHQRPVTPNA